MRGRYYAGVVWRDFEPAEAVVRLVKRLNGEFGSEALLFCCEAGAVRINFIGNQPVYFIKASDLSQHRIHRSNRFTQADILSFRIDSLAATGSGIQTVNKF